ncbi:aldehyde-activating protein [Permianibacter sp. IMCC34836]|nr:aldehyde-activating protein [Permianibacter fluminis]
MQGHTGGCYCGNLHFTMQLANGASSYQPRACDCDFCCKHGAAWLSDPAGSLYITVEDSTQLRRFRQGSEQAEFLLCGQCGVLIGVCYQQAGQRFAAVNVRAVASSSFAAVVPASPKQLSASEKTARWLRLWFPNVVLKTV